MTQEERNAHLVSLALSHANISHTLQFIPGREDWGVAPYQETVKKPGSWYLTVETAKEGASSIDVLGVANIAYAYGYAAYLRGGKVVLVPTSERRPMAPPEDAGHA